MKHKSSNRRTVKPLLLMALLMIALTSLYPRTYEIKPDGTGHFRSISAGINAASHGDILLVYPGRYYENIDYAGKNIKITSLYGIHSEDRSIIRQTIIDGNQRGTVVLFDGRETRQAVLNGFTITNGLGGLEDGINRYRGGGISIQGSSPVISNCIVEYNSASGGGGIVHRRRGTIPSNAFLAGNIVRYNYSIFTIGGLASHDYIELCNSNLNSFYFNYGGRFSNDFSFTSNQNTVVIDTATVSTNSDDHLFRVYSDIEDFELAILHGKIEPVAADLYVSPNGCNDNSGLSAEEPLKSIALAISKIKPDSLERRNIFVDEGVYTFSMQDQQQFPILLRSNINIIGAEKTSTILDMENRFSGFSSFYPNNTQTDHDNEYISNFSINNFTITNGGDPYHRRSPGIYLYYASNFELEDIDITNGLNANFSALDMNYVFDFSLNNITLEDLHGGQHPLRIGNADGASSVIIKNVKIHKIRPLYDRTDAVGGGIFIWTGDRATNFPFSMTISNLEVTDCHYGRTSFPDSKMGIIRYINDVQSLCDSPRKLRIINATIGDNFLADNNIPYRYAAAISFQGKVQAEIINSILWGNRPDEIIFWNPRVQPMELTVRNSLIRGGRDDIKIYSPDGPPTINWDDNNLDTDPMWMEDNDLGYYHYMLNEDSPARGAGTLDIPDFEFPEFDLAGNPRIVDGQIDMGAYQWRRLRVRRGDTERERQSIDDFRLRNFPNPAVTLMNHGTVGIEGHRSSTTGTNIAFEAPNAGNVMIEIYNLKGQFVKRIYDAFIPKGEHNVFWDGRDERGRYVATGFYMYNLHFNEQLVATGRATFIK